MYTHVHVHTYTYTTHMYRPPHVVGVIGTSQLYRVQGTMFAFTPNVSEYQGGVKGRELGGEEGVRVEGGGVT